MSETLRLTRGKLTLPLLVLIGGMVLSVVLGMFARQEIERGAEARFDASAAIVGRSVRDEFDAYTEVLIGLRALFNTTDTVTRAQFTHYVNGLGLDRHFPGFRALNFVPQVSADQRDAFEQRMRREGGPERPDFKIMPRGERAEYYPVALVEPLQGNEHALGNDIAMNPAALAALQRSRDSGELTSSGRTIFIGGDKKDVGLAMRLPVYRAGAAVETVQERRAAYVGSVGAGFRIAEMMRVVLRNTDPSIRLRVLDGGAAAMHGELRLDSLHTDHVPATTEANLVFDNQAKRVQAADDFVRRMAFEVGGRSWVVQIDQDREHVLGWMDRATPAAIVAAGSAVSVLLAGMLLSLTLSRGRAVGMAVDMTRTLRASRRHLDEAQALANLGSWQLDTASGTLVCSREARRIFGFADEQAARLQLSDMLDCVAFEDRALVDSHIDAASLSRGRSEFEARLHLPDGAERWVQMIVQAAEEDGKAALRGTVRDDTQRKRGARRLQLEHDIAKLLVSDGEADLVIARALSAVCNHLDWDAGLCWGVGRDGVAHCGPAWQVNSDPALDQFVRVSRSLTYRADEGAFGLAWARGDAVRIDTMLEAREFTREALARQAGLATGVLVPLQSGGRPAALEFFSRKQRVHDDEALESLRAVAMQIGQYEQRKQAEQALRYVASHDALTGLSNRASLHEHLNRAMKRSNRHQKRLAVMFADLDGFKHINDTLGHGVGDAMIKGCAQRLQGLLRDGDAVVRFGGDEFVLVLEDLSAASDAAVVADKVLAACAEPFVIDGRELHVSVSVGVSVYPEDGADGETLLKNADTAMYRAKDKGRGNVQFYAAQMNAQGTERLMLESGLRRAVERGELELHYQPKMNLRTRQITGVEALMRWRHPVLGLVPPGQFIPIAEETGLIEAMGKWALGRACTDARMWQDRGLPPLQMAVNLSPRQLNSPRLLDDIRGVLSASGLDPALLELEITESAMMKNPEHAAALLADIRAMGVRLAIDDFGTGYSSLSYLKRFPLSTVKVDRSFVKDLSQDQDAQALTAGIIGLAHGLRMKVVAEGVETQDQTTFLRNQQCDEIQGYLLCKPAPADEVCDFMTRHLRTLFASTVAA